MKKTLLAASLGLATVFAFGCDEKKEASSPEVQKAADKTADQAANAMDNTKSAVKDATADAKTAADNNAAAAKSGADANASSIDTLIGKAKDAIKDKKWSDADNYVGQIESLKSKLPADVQPKIDASLADVKKLIAAGKMMMPGN